MTVEERRRIALHRAAAETWGEEVADTLVELVAPSGHELATRDDIHGILAAMDAMDERWDARITALEQRWDARITALEQSWDERLTASEERWNARDAATEARTESMEHRLTAAFERGIREAITSQTRTLVLSQLASVVVIAGLAFGLSA